MKQIIRQFFLIGLLLSCLALWTNCSQVNFGADSASELDMNSALQGQVAPQDIPEFKCSSITVVTIGGGGGSDILDIPARSADGACFAFKLMDAIASSSSGNTTVSDNEVISRNHEAGSSERHPYLMGRTTLKVNLRGVRKLRLSGAADDATPILVDNFVLVGFGPVGGNLNYKAYGPSDSAVAATNSVRLNGEDLAVEAFASGGVATIGLLDVTQPMQKDVTYKIDVRAEDCGGTRNLSDIYLVFQ
jgi:hypothetical protein